MSKRLINIVLTVLFAYNSVIAQTASWIIKPTRFTSMEKVSQTLLRVQEAGLFGMINVNGETIVNTEFDSITNYSEGYCLALKQNKLKAIIDEYGNIILITDEWQVDIKNPYFSEGLLAVKDKKDNWGFITTNGTLKISCKYKMAFPFSCGLASVRFSDGFFAPIDLNGNVCYLRNSFNNKDLIFLSSFSEINGRIISVVCVDKQIYLCDTNGNIIGGSAVGKTTGVTSGKIIISSRNAKIKEITFDDKWRIQSLIKNDGSSDIYKYSDSVINHSLNSSYIIGYKKNEDGSFSLLYDGKPIIINQFDDVTPVSNTTSIVRKGGFYGLLAIDNNSKINMIVNDDHISLHHHTVIPVSVKIIGINSDKAIARIICNGKQIVSNGIINNGELSFNYSFDELMSKTNKLSYSIFPVVDDIEYPCQEIELTVDYSPLFLVSVPTKRQLNPDNSCVFNLTISNRDTKDSDLCDIYFDNKRVSHNIVISSGKSITIPIDKTIDIADNDYVVNRYKVEIRESLCPIYSSNVSIEFERYFIND